MLKLKHQRDFDPAAFMPISNSLPPSEVSMLPRKLQLFSVITVSIILLSIVPNAHAAGGVYAVDDGGVNAPGECNVDLWHQSARHDHANQQSVLSPACTFGALPWAQLGIEVEHGRQDGLSQTQLSPQLKVPLFEREALGLQVALASSAHVALNRSHAFDGADLNLPLTYSPSQAMRLNLNAGFSQVYDDGRRDHRWGWGAGLEFDLGQNLTLIVERYGQHGGEQAVQAGPRLHIGNSIDLDLVFGNNLAEGRDRWLSTGTTLRF
nr:hypothetical protein [uncultured Pseudomonas sp.]